MRDCIVLLHSYWKDYNPGPSKRRYPVSWKSMLRGNIFVCLLCVTLPMVKIVLIDYPSLPDGEISSRPSGATSQGLYFGS